MPTAIDKTATQETATITHAYHQFFLAESSIVIPTLVHFREMAGVDIVARSEFPHAGPYFLAWAD